MTRSTKISVSIALLTAAIIFGWMPSEGMADDATESSAVPKRVVVQFKPNAAKRFKWKSKREPLRSNGKSDRQAKVVPVEDVDPSVAAIMNRTGSTRVTALHAVDPAREAIAARHGLDRFFIIELSDEADAADVANELASLTDIVESAEVDVWGEVAQLIPDDPLFCDQYGLHQTGTNCAGSPSGVVDSDVDAPEAWDIHTGDPGTVTIAIIDTGVDPHPEYTSRLVPGWNVAENNADTSDGCRHGTHVAGIAAAGGNDATGIAGMSWGANIMPVKVFAGLSPCGGFASTVATGIRWAVDNGADICNLSVQFSSGTAAFESAVNYAHDNGVLVVSATGNSGQGSIAFPARYTNSMAVGATDFNDTRPSFSNFGPELDVVAPGWQIISTWTNDICIGGTTPGAVCFGASGCPGVCVGGADDGDACTNGFQCAGLCVGGSNDGATCFSDTQCPDGVCDGVSNCTGGNCSGTESSYYTQSGTSMATPLVAGVAALLKSYDPALSPTEIRKIITCTAEDRGTPGWDKFYGHGRVNAHHAMIAASGVTPWMCGPELANGTIDARQPRDIGDTIDQGWTYFDLEFYGDTSGLSPGDFSLLEDNAPAPSLFPLVVTSSPLADHMRVILNRPLSPGVWTTIQHHDSETPVWYGFLPGDANGNGSVEISDMQTLLDALSDPLPPPIWSIDMDRSGELTPADLLRHIDLLQGGKPYAVYLGTSLP